jgi:hypothetical protein
MCAVQDSPIAPGGGSHLDSQDQRHGERRLSRWTVTTWVAVAILLFDAGLALVLGIRPKDVLGELRIFGPFLWVATFMLWAGAMVWRLWGNRRLAFWRVARCGVIIFGTIIPLALFASLFVWVGSLALSIQRAKADLVGGADLPAIRQWAQEYQPGAKDLVLPSGDVVVDRQNLPPCILKLEPLAGVFFSPQTKEVRISQGSGLGHWGLAVTKTDAWVFDSE